MANDGFEGATLQWTPDGGQAGDLGPLTNISDDLSGAEVDVSGSGDSTKNYEVGISDETVSCEIKGAPASGAVGDKGAVGATWPDSGTEGSIASPAMISGISVSGRLDGPITSTITFKKASTTD